MPNKEIFKTSKKGVPLSGTFISMWLVQNWTDETWEEEINAYKQAGMEYIIISPAVLMDKERNIVSYYDTTIERFKDGYVGVDVFENIFRNCQKHNMKVFMGTLQEDEWWEYWWNHSKTLAAYDWVIECMKTSNEIAKDVYEKYSPKYKDVMYGWYLIWEIWNMPTMALNARGRNQMISMLSDGLNVHLDFLTEISPHMPVLTSPFVNTTLTSIEDLKWQWADLINNTNFRKGDILCPQDSIGAGGTKIDQLDSVMQAYVFAKSFKPEMVLWANNEDFEQYDWSTTTLDRFVKQLEITSKYAEKNITFAYNNYYSPINVKNGFHDAYLYYKETGCLKIQDVAAPENVTYKITSEGTIINWSQEEDDLKNIAGYIIFADGIKIGTVRCKHKNGLEQIPEVENSYTDKRKFEKTMNSIKYDIIAHDFFGNYSLETSINIVV